MAFRCCLVSGCSRMHWGVLRLLESHDHEARTRGHTRTRRSGSVEGRRPDHSALSWMRPRRGASYHMRVLATTCLRTTKRTGAMTHVRVGLVGMGEENRALAQVLAGAREDGFDTRRTDRCTQPRRVDARRPAGAPVKLQRRLNSARGLSLDSRKALESSSAGQAAMRGWYWVTRYHD